MKFRMVLEGPPVTWKRVGRRAGAAFVPKEVREYQGWIKAAAKTVFMGRKPWTGPVLATIWVAMPQKKDGGEPSRQGDLDNYAKGALDALQSLVFENDRQVVSLRVERINSCPGGCLWVEIEEAPLGYISRMHEPFQLTRSAALIS